MNRTSIEWCDFTVNPIRFRNRETGKVGHYCEKISAGCANCYASRMQKGPYLSGLEFIAGNKDKGELFFDDAVLQQVLRRRKPATLFWADMSDLFGPWVPNHWIYRCAAVCALTPHVTHIWLTKRSRRMRESFADGEALRNAVWCEMDHGTGLDFFGRPPSTGIRQPPWPLPNLILGVSCENRNSLHRLDDLRETPAACRMLSAEPLLEDLGQVNLDGIGWVIVGGESGPGARPCNVEWIRLITEQCRTDRVPCFVKQLGSRPVQMCGRCRDGARGMCRLYGADIRRDGFEGHGQDGLLPMILKHSKGGDPSEWPEDLRARERPEMLRG